MARQAQQTARRGKPATGKRVGAAHPHAAAESALLVPPKGGAVVRMYRIGHGDCFLIAFDGKKVGRPTYVMIDCGYKPGSPDKLSHPTKAKEIGADILAATGGVVDVAIVTHEHQDHLNGFTSTNFPKLKVGEVWFAWTEDGSDDLANKLRKKFKDRLLRLIDARTSLRGMGLSAAADQIDDYLEFELGESPEGFCGAILGAAGKDPSKSVNKIAMKFLRDCAGKNAVRYLMPHGKPLVLPGASSARAFVLGPPHDLDAIDDLDPRDDESFGDDDHAQALAVGAGTIGAFPQARPLFSRRHRISLKDASKHTLFGPFFSKHFAGQTPTGVPVGEQAADDADWRRIGGQDGEDEASVALAMNNATNNSSLVLAFELAESGKVLLFAGDAQAGNWRSWSQGNFTDKGKKITAKSLLERTVLYKVGHHGSHNATLNGDSNSEHANLSWMAQGDARDEFVAMITAVEKWAHQKPKPDWNHPFPPIKEALEEMTGHRILQTDESIPEKAPKGARSESWKAFLERVTESDLYFELRIYP